MVGTVPVAVAEEMRERREKIHFETTALTVRHTSEEIQA